MWKRKASFGGGPGGGPGGTRSGGKVLGGPGGIIGGGALKDNERVIVRPNHKKLLFIQLLLVDLKVKKMTPIKRLHDKHFS